MTDNGFNMAIDPEDDDMQRVLVKRLKSRYSDETADFSDEELLSIVKKCLNKCASLEIFSEKDIFRFIALSVLITTEQMKSRLIEGVFKRILANLDWSSKKRLDFLYKHVVGRFVSQNEIDFGEGFIPDYPETQNGDNTPE